MVKMGIGCGGDGTETGTLVSVGLLTCLAGQKTLATRFFVPGLLRRHENALGRAKHPRNVAELQEWASGA